MKLKELKASLSKIPPDMGDLEIVLMTVNSDEEIQYSLLAFTGIIENPVYALALGDEDTVYKLQENGRLKFKKDLE